MSPVWQALPRPCESFHVWTHYVRNPAHLCRSMKFFTCTPPILQAIPQGLEGNIQTDLASIFKAVGHGFGHGGDGYAYSVEQMVLHALVHGRTRETNDAKARSCYRRPMGFFANGNPDFGWRLRSYFVITQSREQTDHAGGNARCDFRQSVMLIHRRIAQTVHPTRHTLQTTASRKPGQIPGRNTG